MGYSIRMVESAESAQQDVPGAPVSEPVLRRRGRFGPPRVRIRTFDSFRYRDYLLIWASTVLSSGGFWVQQVIVGWLTYNITKSAFLTSLALGIDTLPILLVGPLGGVLADRWDRRKLLVLVYAYQSLITLGFSALVFAQVHEPWHIFAFIIAIGASWIIVDPVRMSLIPRMVPREGLVNAFALNGLAFNSSRLIAPGIAGGLLVVAGAGSALLFEAGLQAAAVAMALGLRVRSTERRGGGPASALRDVREAALYAWGTPLIRSLFMVSVVPALLIMPFVHGLMPVYAAEVFAVEAGGLGLLMASIGAGATIGALAMASVGEIRRKGRIVLISMAIMAASMLVFSRNTHYGLAFPNILVLSAGMAMFFTSANATLQGTTKDEFRGRVSALFMLTWGVFPVGSLLAGTLAAQLTVRSATLVGGAAVSLIIVALALGPARILLREPEPGA